MEDFRRLTENIVKAHEVLRLALKQFLDYRDANLTLMEVHPPVGYILMNWISTSNAPRDAHSELEYNLHRCFPAMQRDLKEESKRRIKRHHSQREELLRNT